MARKKDTVSHRTRELSVICSFLLEGTGSAFMRAARKLRPDHFSEPDLRATWKCMGRLADKGQPVTPYCVLKTWKSSEQYPALEVEQNLEKLAMPVDICLEHEVPELIKAFVDIQTKELLSQLGEGKLTPEGLKNELEGILTENADLDHLFSSEDAVERLYDRLKKAETGFAGTPFSQSDLFDFEFGGYTIIAARPSVGKTALAITFLNHFLFENPLKTLFVTFEMSTADLMRRVVSAGAKIPMEKLRRGGTLDGYQEDLDRFTKSFREADRLMFHDCSGAGNAEAMFAQIEYCASVHDVRVVIVDYIQIVRTMKSYDSRRERIIEISAKLKAIGKKHSLVMIVLAQLNRPAPGGAKNQRPRVEHIADCSYIEQDADLILLLHRAWLQKESKYQPETELLCAKQRDGKTGMMELYFQKEFCRFEVVTPADDRQEAEEEDGGWFDEET